MMKKAVLVLTLLLAGFSLAVPTTVLAYNYGDYRSTTLVGKAWKALNEGDIEAVLAYTNKCIELYGDQAKEMQESLSDFPMGEKDQIFSYWALNDVATAHYIQAEIYRKEEMYDEAKEAYNKVINDYKYGQCWDTQGWFWKPSDASKEKLSMLESGKKIDFGDYTSSYLTTQAWKALGQDDIDLVNVYVGKVLELYEGKAREMQDSLTEYPWETKEKIFSYWALNDVGTSLFIQGEAYRKAGEYDKAKESFKKLVDDYFYSQCWDPNGWFWKPAEAGQQKLDEIGDV